MPRVKLPDGTGVNFPDGTDPAVMESAMREYWWKHNDAIMARDKAAKAAPALPAQGQPMSPAGTGTNGITIPLPTGPITLPSGEDVRNFLAGAGRRADSILNRGAQILNPSDDAVQRGVSQIEAEKTHRDAPLMNTGMGKTGEAATDVALTALPAAKMVKGAAAFASPLARTMAGLAGAGSLNGLYDAGTKPVREGDTTVGNAAEGFGWGVGGQVLGNTGAKIIKGLVPAVKKAIDPITGRVKAMYDDATLGQIADKEHNVGRIVNATEEGVGSIPIIGSVIRNRRKAGVESWRNQLLDEVRPPGSAPTSGETGERIGQLQDSFGDAYDTALAGHDITPDANFRASVFRRALDPSSGLPPDVRKTLAQNVDEQYTDLFRPGTVGPHGPQPPVADAATLKAFESRLGAQARGRSTSTSPDGPALGALTGDMRDDLRRSYRSQLPLSTGSDLRALDAQYAPFKTVEKAATATGNQEGQFTPPQLLQAVKSRTSTPEFAARQGMLQDTADTGKQVFQNRLSDSGTIERGLLTGGVLGGATFLHPSAALVPAAVFAGTTKSGRNFGIGATRAQLLLKKLRADRLAHSSGVGLSQSVEDLLEQ